MKEKVIQFVRNAVERQRKALQKYERTSQYTEATNNMLANQCAKDTEVLALWETLQGMISDPLCIDEGCPQFGTAHVCVPKTPTRREYAEAIWEGYHPYRNSDDERIVNAIIDVLELCGYIKVKP